MFRSLFTVSGWTGISRILGFVREMLIAATLGAGPVADAFFVAFRLPNMFRRIFAEGAYASAFVPLLSDEMQAGGMRARDFANNALSWLIMILVIFGIMAMVFMGGLVNLLASGFRADPEKFALAVTLGRICFAYLLFMAVTAHISGILNAMGRFAAAAAAPVLLNIFFILSLLLVVPFTNAPGHVLAWTVSVAGIAQVALVWRAARKAGFDLRLVVPKASASMWRLLKLMVPGTISAGVQQINLLIGTSLVSVYAGAVSFVTYADRIYQLPLGLIGIGLGIVLLPSLSRKISAGETAKATHQLNRGIELCLLLSIPSAVALFVIAEPVVIGLFERGAFTRDVSVSTALALQAYAIGVPAFVVNKVLLPGFYARKDTRTPMIYAIASMVFFVTLALLLVRPYGFVGVAAATSLASWFNIVLLIYGLKRAGFWQADRRLVTCGLRTLAAAVLMGLALWIAYRLTADWFNGSGLARICAMLLLVGTGACVYAVGVLATRAVQPSELKALLKR